MCVFAAFIALLATHGCSGNRAGSDVVTDGTPAAATPASAQGLARANACRTICARATSCDDAPGRTPDREATGTIPDRILNTCARGCENVDGPITALERRTVDCAAIDGCEGFAACTAAIFDPSRQDRACRAICREVSVCLGDTPRACVQRCRASPEPTPCTSAESCAALIQCQASWGAPEGDRTTLQAASPSSASTVTAREVCAGMCRREVLCEARANDLSRSESLALLDAMDQGLVSCELDCVAFVKRTRPDPVLSCVQQSTCDDFQACVNEL